MCGASDCSTCFPFDNVEQDEIEPDEIEPNYEYEDTNDE